MAKRRANGEGSIRKRKDGRWEGRYTAGRDPVTGTLYWYATAGKGEESRGPSYQLNASGYTYHWIAIG